MEKMRMESIQKITDVISANREDLMVIYNAKLALKKNLFKSESSNQEREINKINEILIPRTIYATCEYFKPQINDVRLSSLTSLGQYNPESEYKRIKCLTSLTTCDILKEYGASKYGEYNYYVSILRLIEVILFKNDTISADAKLYCVASKKGVEHVRYQIHLNEWIEKNKLRYNSNEFIQKSNINELTILALIELNGTLKSSGDYSENMVVLHIGLLCFVLTNSCSKITNNYDDLFYEIYDLYYTINKKQAN